MLVFLNSESFVGQESDLHHGGLLITQMMYALDELLKIRVCDCKLYLETGSCYCDLYRDSELRDKPVAGNQTLIAVLTYRLRELKTEPQLSDEALTKDRFTVLMNRITRLPFANEELELSTFVCERGDKDVTYTALGYAAHCTFTPFEGTGATAAVVSLAKCPEFEDSKIAVMHIHEEILEERQVWNVIQRQDVLDVKRTYKPYGKHDPTATATAIGVKGSPIGLSRDEARMVLNGAVALPDDRRLFARHQGHIYIFHCEDEANRHYHGFRVEVAEFKQRQANIYTLLRRHFEWPELS